jgi:hypothetical protein
MIAASLRDTGNEWSSRRPYRPVLTLVSDGQNNDGTRSFEQGLAQLTATPLGTAAIRSALAVDDDADETVLRCFVDGSEGAYGKVARPELISAWLQDALRRSIYLSAAVGVPVVAATLDADGATRAAGNVPRDDASIVE